MVNKEKLFAFKLAAKQQKKEEANKSKWKAREGLAVAGCTDFRWPGNLRYSDNGVYC